MLCVLDMWQTCTANLKHLFFILNVIWFQNHWDVTVPFLSHTDQPNITNISGNQRVNETDTVNLTCEADGNPRPTTTWTRVSDSGNVSIPLIITGKQDEGDYRCTASNGVGSGDSRTVNIFVKCKLQVPTTLFQFFVVVTIASTLWQWFCCNYVYRLLNTVETVVCTTLIRLLTGVSCKTVLVFI